MKCFKIVAGGGTIPTTYSTSDTQSKIFGTSVFVGKQEFIITNKSGAAIAFTYSDGTSAPTADVKDIYLQDQESFTLQDNFPPNTKFYIRSESGSAITIPADGYVAGFIKELTQ